MSLQRWNKKKTFEELIKLGSLGANQRVHRRCWGWACACCRGRTAAAMTKMYRRRYFFHRPLARVAVADPLSNPRIWSTHFFATRPSALSSKNSSHSDCDNAYPNYEISVWILRHFRKFVDQFSERRSTFGVNCPTCVATANTSYANAQDNFNIILYVKWRILLLLSNFARLLARIWAFGPKNDRK